MLILFGDILFWLSGFFLGMAFVFHLLSHAPATSAQPATAAEGETQPVESLSP